MTAHDWFIEHRTEYAAGALTAEEMAAFAAHLERCDDCRAAVERIESELRWLPMGVSPVTPRPGLQHEMLLHATGRAARGGGWRRWPVPTAVAAALVGVLAGWLGARASAPAPASSSAQAAALVTELAALRDTVSIMRHAAKVMQARIEMQGSEGGMVIFADATTHRWNVVLHGLPTAPADERYQFWFTCADGMVRGASLNVQPGTPVVFTTGMPAGPCEVTGAALTVEPMRSADGPPQGRELAKVSL